MRVLLNHPSLVARLIRFTRLPLIIETPPAHTEQSTIPHYLSLKFRLVQRARHALFTQIIVFLQTRDLHRALIRLEAPAPSVLSSIVNHQVRVVPPILP